jgi:hypothetical protein
MTITSSKELTLLELLEIVHQGFEGDYPKDLYKVTINDVDLGMYYLGDYVHIVDYESGQLLYTLKHDDCSLTMNYRSEYYPSEIPEAYPEGTTIIISEDY